MPWPKRCQDPAMSPWGQNIGYQKTSTWRGLSDELVHTKTSQGLIGQTLPLDFGQELDEDKLLSLAFETLHHHTMADAQKTDEDCLNHLAGNCPFGLP